MDHASDWFMEPQRPMTMPAPARIDAKPVSADRYRTLPLIELVRLIAVQRDGDALEELHGHRRPFCSAEGNQVRFVEYVDELRQGRRAWARVHRSVVVLDRAYDLTVDKFSRLERRAASAAAAPRHRNGTDCSRYYAALVRRFTAEVNAGPALGELRREVLCAALLQGLVRTHFDLSCREQTRRLAGPVRRYDWRTNGDTLRLRLPTRMSGRQCRRWLEANVDEPDAARPGERDRVQAIVDARLLLPRLVALGHAGDRREAAPESVAVLPWPVLHEISTEGLAEAVAREKVENIHLQRPAIQRLGREKLRGLIFRIFDDLAAEAYDAAAVAGQFGLSAATLSRFAGSRWNQRTGGSASVPDLFLNTAHLLARVPAFVQAARAAGVWPQVENIRRRHPREGEKGHVE